jgi:NAD(P)-dependent dehydrogenase (short-subunit alcohol dehydrogenase family)
VKRVLITGTSSGFGRDLCTAFLESGWSVYATLRGAQARRELFAADEARYGKALTVLSLDVTDAGQREKAARAVEVDGGLDCLVNNAGFGLIGPFEELSEEQWRGQMEVNFFGAVFLTRRLLPSLRESKGKVINVSSVLGLTAFPLNAAYCASKFAVEGMSEALYYELKPHGVQVALVEPGAVRTKMAQNLVHPTVPDASVYRGQMDAYERMLAKMLKRPGTPTTAVVNAVVRLAESRRMPLRTIVGKDAHAMGALQKLLPRNWSSSLMAGVYGKLLTAKNGR